MIQRSPEWYVARLGKATGSRIADIMARTKSGYSTSRKNYAAELACERLTGKTTESYTNSAMQWGVEHEAEAKRVYEIMNFVDVIDVGFIDHPSIPMSGASPDGLIGDDGLIEIKCPNTATHIETLTSGVIDRKYILQMQWQLACTERAWCDFMSFDPRLPENASTFIKRVYRDQKMIDEIEAEVLSFLVEVDEMVNIIKNYRSES